MSGADEEQQPGGDAWGDDIPPGRQAELKQVLHAWEQEADHGERQGSFAGVPLSGADVGWLAQRVRKPWGGVPDLHLEGASLSKARLEGATLGYAHLEGASLFKAHLEGADLVSAHLEAVNLGSAHLDGANLHGAYLDRVTFLDGISLSDDVHGSIHLADVRWGDVNLAIVDWTHTRRGFLRLRRRIEAVELGDERAARQDKDTHGKRKDNATRLRDYMAAVRANRQLATVLRSQGLNEDADRFAYKAQTLQREVLRRQRRYGAAFGSWCLDVLAGYGYRPGQAVSIYLLLIALFAVAYYAIGLTLGPQLPPVGALVFSVTSFHGRGFFPGGSPGHSVTLDDPITVLAAAEAVVGLIVEISFIATFTQRFFAR